MCNFITHFWIKRNIFWTLKCLSFMFEKRITWLFSNFTTSQLCKFWKTYTNQTTLKHEKNMIHTVFIYGHPIEHRVHLLSGPIDLDFQTAGRFIQLYNVEVRGSQWKSLFRGHKINCVSERKSFPKPSSILIWSYYHNVFSSLIALN